MPSILAMDDVGIRKQRVPTRPEGFASIRLLFGGICNTDLELQRGYYGYSGTPGHEFVGEVIAADSKDSLGRRVVGEINLACGNCSFCTKGLGRHCPKRKVLGIVKHPGAFREILTLPERNLHVVPAAIPTEHAAFVEPVGAACEILDQVRIPKGEAVAVLGDGKLGLLIAQVLQASGARVHQFGRHRDKLRIAEAVGVTGEIAGEASRPTSTNLLWTRRDRAEGLTAGVAHGASTRDRRYEEHRAWDGRDRHRAGDCERIHTRGSRCGRLSLRFECSRKEKIRVDDMISEILPLSSAPRGIRACRQARCS